VIRAESAGPTSLAIAPGSVVVPVQAGGGLTPYVYCEFEGPTRRMRGFLAVIDPGGTRTMLPAVK
jgi:hypothetical protein